MARVTARIEINETGLEQQSGVILRRKHRSLTRQIATEARVRVPVDTGRLGQGIQEMPQRYRPFHVDGGVEDDVEYAAAVHEGSRPHRIVARKAEALHFWWHGREIFRKSVWHPGTRSRPFLRNAGEAVIARDPHINRV
ncbi:tail assembly chaperone [Mycobacterium phage Serendipitous]|uniref:Tail assembly chaperone n=1 Tax=Mycobacterium phage Serendipitous TaxID=2301619 RepID=A0A385UHC8_9CAUD|nr:tail assembly chaperone [Mycobacterium phage Serendipitous]AYB70566.1 tail assembly chaperone [Mycobacterium phage Serendipitous]